MAKSTVSIIVPIYNVEPYLHRCVDSILAQTLSEIEIILVDDGSPDGCPEICDEYAERDSRIKVIHQENKGVSAARNAGLKEAGSAYITFIDSDDWIEPCMYEIMVAAAESTGADIVTCNFRAHYPDRIKENVMDMHDDIRDFKHINYFEFYETFGQQSSIFAWNSLYRNHIIKQYSIIFQPMQIVLSEDQLFNLCYYAAVKRAVYIKESYYNYFLREGSLCHKEPATGILNARITLVLMLKCFIEDNRIKNQKFSFFATLMWCYFVDGCGMIQSRQRLLDEISNIKANKKFFRSCLNNLLFGKAGRYQIKRNKLSFKASLYFRYMLLLMLLDRYDKLADTFLLKPQQST